MNMDSLFSFPTLESQNPLFDEIETDLFSFEPTHKSSLDLSCFFDVLPSPSSSASSYSSEEVPVLELGACGDVRTLLRVKKSECYARECKARRAARMLILKRKREQGLISFETKVRYKQRSEMALKRDRCSGRFLSDIEYIDVNWCVCFTKTLIPVVFLLTSCFVMSSPSVLRAEKGGVPDENAPASLKRLIPETIPPPVQRGYRLT